MQLSENNKPIWDLYKDGVTQSLIVKWLQCPLQCELEYYHGWTSIKKSEPLLFGSVCHYILEQAYNKTEPPSDKNIESYITSFRKRIEKDNESLSSVEFEKREILYCKAVALIKAYFFHFRKDFDYKWLFLEKRFSIHYGHGICVNLCGMLDGAFLIDKNSKDVYLIDHKFLSMINIEHKETLLPADFQLNFYLYATREYLKKIDPELKIKGFYYNICRRPGLKYLKSDTSLKMYEERIFEEILKKPSYYFYSERHKENNQDSYNKCRDPLFIPVADIEIDRWEQYTLRPILREIEKWFESDFKWPGYYNPVALETKYGLATTTRAILYKDFSELYQRKVPFQELET